MSQFEQSGREREFNPPLPFHSNQTLKGLDDAHSHWGRLSTLVSLLIQTRISSRRILIVHPEMMFDLGTMYPSQVDTEI